LPTLPLTLLWQRLPIPNRQRTLGVLARLLAKQVAAPPDEKEVGDEGR
jgi:hypothetical protein